MIEAEVAFVEDQFRVADLPRSMELGSAEIVTVGFGGGAGSGAGGGGGGGGGGSFLQPAAKTAKNTLSMISAT
ncbi:MAG: hypothetical protein OXH92_15710 [Bryobacterales bacterium]|nr:hypothetical protein [Bryobacterales bacterium]MDE0435452.1 hypothetical protein [Bryobacterales bacterium]